MVGEIGKYRVKNYPSSSNPIRGTHVLMTDSYSKWATILKRYFILTCGNAITRAAEIARCSVVFCNAEGRNMLIPNERAMSKSWSRFGHTNVEMCNRFSFWRYAGIYWIFSWKGVFLCLTWR